MRHGSVIVFKENVTPEEAANALESIADLLDTPDESFDYELKYDESRQENVAVMHQRPFKFSDLVREFNEEFGGPVWYIP